MVRILWEGGGGAFFKSNLAKFTNTIKIMNNFFQYWSKFKQCRYNFILTALSICQELTAEIFVGEQFI